MQHRNAKRRNVSFRVSEPMYQRIGEEATGLGVSMAEFAREAVIGRTILQAARSGRPWTNDDAWQQVVASLEDPDALGHDRRRR
jgi:hypothetical protein